MYDATWEPEQNLENAKEILAAYLRHNNLRRWYLRRLYFDVSRGRLTPEGGVMLGSEFKMKLKVSSDIIFVSGVYTPLPKMRLFWRKLAIAANTRRLRRTLAAHRGNNLPWNTRRSQDLEIFK